MALQSPGVEVTVIDESFYTPAEPGTTPLIVVATGQDKSNAAGTGTASATTKANAGKAFTITSQKDLVDLFGVPFFEKTASSTPIHGSERNEYGLLAAYSLLGVSNAAFIVRADVDLNQLVAQDTAPGANPADGQWWVDTQSTAWGIQEWNGNLATTTGGQKFSSKKPLVLTDDDETRVESTVSGRVPKASVGAIGDYAVLFETVDGSGSFDAERETAKVFYKSAGNGGTVPAGTWVLLGSNEWTASHPVVSSTAKSGSFSFNLVVNNAPIVGTGNMEFLANTITGANITGVSAQAINNKLYIYTDGTSAADGSIIDSSAADGSVLLENGSTTWSDIGGIVAGLYAGPKLQQTPHTTVPDFKRSPASNTDKVAGYPTGSVWVKTTQPNAGSDWIVKRWNAATASWVSFDAYLYASTNAALYYLDRSGGGLNLDDATLFVQTNANENSGFDDTPETAEFRVWKRAYSLNTATVITSRIIGNGTLGAGTNSFSIAESVKGSIALDAKKDFTVVLAGNSDDADTIATAINSAGFVNVEAAVTAANELQIFHKTGGDFRIVDGSNTPIADLFTPYSIDTLTGTANFYTTSAGDTQFDFVATNWKPLSASNFFASSSAPQSAPANGQLWYNSGVNEIDIMVHNGNTWVGYQNQFPNTKATGPTVSASNPYTGGVSFADNDLWISTADLENFPTIYRYNSNISGVPNSEKWELVDKTDQTTEEGILFADARYSDAGSTGNTAAAIATLLSSNYLDPDAPDAALYPKGMLLWNLRRSDGNVKRYVTNYIDKTERNPRYDADNSDAGNAWVNGEFMTNYNEVDRWVTASPNAEDGSGTFLRKAQRAVVVAALKSVVDTSSEIRDEERRNFNIIACPGYPELMSNLVNLNIDRGVTSFVIGDTPLRLASDATTLTNWGTNAELVTDNGDNGIVTYDEYLGVFYPSGFTTDLGGSNAVVPSSHMMLRTIALSDNASYPWFAPAGTRRGGITNATSVGYIDGATGEFQTVALNEGQRDTLYNMSVNPITFFNGVGLINFGQKTRARNASALDRINVARLTVYLRSQLNKLARPYIFEPNDQITRDEIKQACESLLLELVGLRALYDFAVVCDESNNTPARIDRNELWVDIAIEPVKAVEFIYIPLRVKNTGEI